MTRTRSQTHQLIHLEKKAQSTFLRESLSPRRHCRRHRPRQDRRPRRQRHCLN